MPMSRAKCPWAFSSDIACFQTLLYRRRSIILERWDADVGQYLSLQTCIGEQRRYISGSELFTCIKCSHDDLRSLERTSYPQANR